MSILNTTAAQTAVINNLKAAFNFTLGDALVENFQIVVALYMNKLLKLITQIELYFSLSCIPLFLILAFYYWNLSPDNQAKSIKAKFFKKGLKISALNGIAIHFWMVYLHLFQIQNWCGYDYYKSHWCILGFCIGTIGALMIYALLGQSLRKWLITFEKWFNKVLSIIFMLLTVVIIVKILFY
ncbi:hypothetical protein OAT71_00850 [Flavobacteriales bacterium]|nr:hypothetical protein [Flavobacteriales bacterium]